MFSFFILLGSISQRKKKRKDRKNIVGGGKGVFKIDTRDKLFYLTKKDKCVGVRKKEIVYMTKMNPVSSMLLYNKPCVCGSLSHRTTKDPECFCNDMYIDAVQL